MKASPDEVDGQTEHDESEAPQPVERVGHNLIDDHDEADEREQQRGQRETSGAERRCVLPVLSQRECSEGQSAEDMANALALRLKRLEAIREATDRLFGRPQLGRDVFNRGDPEQIAHIKLPEWSATIYDLLSAYSQQRQKQALSHVRLARRQVWTLAEAREALERLIGQSTDWAPIDAFLIKYVVEPSLAPTIFASSFASALELVREGVADIHQQGAFAPIYMRRRPAAAQPAAVGVADSAPPTGETSE